MWIYALVYLIIINVITFVAYGIDKIKASKKRYRISEKTLILFAVFGGSIGALAAMKIFRHKTLHFKFKFGIPLIFIVQVVAIATIHFYVFK